jgi:parallel beta-helix repeat protein
MRTYILAVFAALLLFVGLSAAVDISGCQEISSPGTYDLTANLAGTGVSLDAPFGGASACIRISASNVVLDCHGYSISNGGSSDSYGIAIQKNETAYVAGVTVRDCSVSDYYGGILAYNTNQSRFTENELEDNTYSGSYFGFPSGGVGIALAGDCGNDTIDNSYANGNFNGFRVDDGNRIVFRDNIAEDNLLETSNGIRGVGFWMYMRNGTVTNNTATGSYRNFRLEGGENNTFTSNVASNGTGIGIYVSGMNNNFTSNIASNNSDDGFYFDDSEYDCESNRIIRNVADGNGGNGFYGENCYSLLVQNNNATGNSQSGFYTDLCDDSLFVNNTASGNSNDGFYLVDQWDSNYTGNLAENSGDGFHLDGNGGEPPIGIMAGRVGGVRAAGMAFASDADCVDGSTCNTIMTNNTARDNQDGFYLNHVMYNRLTDNNIINNYYGIYLDYSDDNTLLRNFINESGYGLYVWFSDDNQMGYNEIYDTDYNNFGSCPFLFTYNGSDFDFVVEISGASVLGRSLGNGAYRRPMAGDYTRVDSSQLQLENGSYSVKVTQEYDEISYVDEVALKTVDHAPEVDIFPTLVTSENGRIYTVSKTPSAPVSCVDADGNDCLPTVLSKDGAYTPLVSGKSNTLELDLGDLSGASEIKLIISGLSSFAGYSSPYHDKKIQVVNASGEWADAYSVSQLAFPPEFPTTNVVNLTGKFPTGDHRVRVIFDLSSFDYIALDTTQQQPVTVNTYHPASADLHFRGYSATSSGPLPVPDYSRVWESISVSSPSGYFTKYGDVLPLLGAKDDEFLIMHHGDEVSLEFPHAPVPDGMERDFLFYNWAYSKPAKNIYGNTVDPLPFAAMSNYPYASNESYPADAEHTAYLADWNTRYFDGAPVMNAGMSLPWSFNNTVFYNTVVGNTWSTGFYLWGEEDTKLLNNRISDVEVGIEVYSSTGTEIRGNDVSAVGGRALMIHQGSSGNIASENTFFSNSTESCDYEGGCGAVYIGRSDENTIQDNELTAFDGTGIVVGSSDDNDILDNRITTTGEEYYAIRTWNGWDNLFLHNTLISDYWVDDSGESGNDYNDETSGNRYYFANGTGSWNLFNITDTSGDGWADEGSDLPFSCDTVGDCENDYVFWINNGEDWHPFTGEVPHDDDPQKSALSLDFDSSCNGTVVTVTARGDPVEGATVSVDGSRVGTSDSDGKVEFDSGCGDAVRVHSTSSGYLPADETFDLVGCGECQPPECATDSDCSSDKRCLEQMCVPVPCECGVVETHQCSSYECCSDAQCAVDESCQSHVCSKKPVYECTSDAQCSATKYCDIPAGAAGGSCKVVAGECGKVENHAFVAYGYECGTEPGCPACGSGFACVSHNCIQNDVTCPSTGIVGDKKTCEAKENNQPCANCDYVVTDPSGKNSTGRTDESGNFDLPLNMQGIYKVALIKNGTVVKVIEVKAFPQAQPEEPTKPAATGPDLGMIIALLVLLLLIVLGVVYWRSRGQRKK